MTAREQTGQSEVTPAGRSAHRRVLRWAALTMVVIGLGLLGGGLISLGVIRLGSTAPPLTGTVLNPPFEAPGFQLHDQFDQPIALSNYRGKVVVLTFLYTNCPDVCPLITATLHQTSEQLGSNADQVAILAISVDPARDTLAQVHAFSSSRDMLHRWHYLIGSMADLEPIWRAYGIGAATASGSLVQHASPTFVIDPKGNVRAILDPDFTPADLIQDIQALRAG